MSPIKKVVKYKQSNETVRTNPLLAVSQIRSRRWQNISVGFQEVHKSRLLPGHLIMKGFKFILEWI